MIVHFLETPSRDGCGGAGPWGLQQAGTPSCCRFHNKGVYVRVGLQKMSHSRSLHREIRLQVEQQEVELPSIEGLIFINIPRCRGWGPGDSVQLSLSSSLGGTLGPCSLHFHLCTPLSRHSWGSGADLWGPDSDSRCEKPRMDDGLLEVVGVTGVMHMVSAGGQVAVGRG